LRNRDALVRKSLLLLHLELPHGDLVAGGLCVGSIWHQFEIGLHVLGGFYHNVFDQLRIYSQQRGVEVAFRSKQVFLQPGLVVIQRHIGLSLLEGVFGEQALHAHSIQEWGALRQRAPGRGGLAEVVQR